VIWYQKPNKVVIKLMWLNLSVPLLIMNQTGKRKLEAFREVCRQQCDMVNWESPWDNIPNPIVDPNIGGDIRETPYSRPVSEQPAPPPPVQTPIVTNNPSKYGDGRNSLKDQFPYPVPPAPSSFIGNTPQIPDTPIPPNPSQNPIDDPPDVVPPPAPPPPVQTPTCPSLHPDATIPGKRSQADEVRAQTTYANNKGSRHDPDGIPWITPGMWTPWDGVTTINPCTSTKQQLMDFIFPKPGGGSNVNTMRGLRELFYQVKPFADNQNPTVAEIENWNIEVIRHFRKLLGFSQATHPVSNHKCTYLRAAWAEERARSNYWTTAYPGTLDGKAGPCTIPYGPNEHCGASFLPSPADQAPYLCPNTMAACTAMSGAEGVSSINTDIPWAIKIGRIIGQYLGTDGIGAHTGPFVGREYFGSAWFVNEGSTLARTKWSGNLAPTCP
jgi:hypothetical protein